MYNPTLLDGFQDWGPKNSEQRRETASEESENRGFIET
jgi:hypothetical protein